MKAITNQRLTNVLVSFFIVVILCILVKTFSSCTSQSGKLDKIVPEKIVILEVKYSHYDNLATITYKVKRIDKGTVDQFTVNTSPRMIKYEVGDTLLRRFLNY